MALGIFLLTIIFGLYFLLVKGILWRVAMGVLGVFAFIGMKAFLLTTFPSSQETCMIVIGYSLGWADVVPTIVLIAAALLPKGE